MSYTPTSLLSFPIITTGSESGVWGDDINNGLTSYLDIAIAGTLSLTSASFTANALTLANTAGTSSATNIAGTTAQYAILKTSSLAANVTITAPSTSKMYLVVNTDATYTVTIKASGQTGYTVGTSSRAWVVFNGTDYVLASTNDITKLSGTLAVANGGTGQTTASAAFNALSPITSTGDLILGNGVNSATRLAIGTNGYILTSNGTTASWAAAPSSMTYPGAGIPVSTGSAWGTSFTNSGSPITVAYGGTGQTSYTDGQLLIGNTTGNTLTKSTLTAGTGISITNGSGSITIATSGSSSSTGANMYLAANFGAF